MRWWFPAALFAAGSLWFQPLRGESQLVLLGNSLLGWELECEGLQNDFLNKHTTYHQHEASQREKYWAYRMTGSEAEWKGGEENKALSGDQWWLQHRSELWSGF